MFNQNTTDQTPNMKIKAPKKTISSKNSFKKKKMGEELRQNEISESFSDRMTHKNIKK